MKLRRRSVVTRSPTPPGSPSLVDVPVLEAPQFFGLSGLACIQEIYLPQETPNVIRFQTVC
jgi:hypothetical protein